VESAWSLNINVLICMSMHRFPHTIFLQQIIDRFCDVKWWDFFISRHVVVGKTFIYLLKKCHMLVSFFMKI
jgi:hypothetical protein